MNALNPKVSVLIKLAQLMNELKDRGHTYIPVLSDPEVLEWYDRMAELEYVPSRQVGFKVGPPTPEMIADAGPPSNFVDQQLGKMLKPLVGYTLSAKHPTEGIICSYAEARSVSLAAERCYDEFPTAENYTEHAVTNTETGEETSLPGLPNLLGKEINELLEQGASSSTLMPLLIEEAEALALELGDEDVVDTEPSALLLDEED